ncbi:uncharacterized protein LOC142346212 [Convolutriloba macropyga]|uniref:uncharacterized protein LOC142346212 n=1 Tax=Convolutriloba macropyga TaxID=536237 RepID=UPI003F51BA12
MAALQINLSLRNNSENVTLQTLTGTIDWDYWRLVVQNFALPLAAVVGLFSNLLTVAASMKLGVNRSSIVFMLLVAISHSGQIFSIILTLFIIPNTASTCEFKKLLNIGSSIASQNELMLLSIDRWLAVTKSTWYSEKLMKKLSYPIICTLINYICSAVVCSPILYIASFNDETNVCLYDENSNDVVRIISLIVVIGFFYLIMPVVVITSVNVTIIFKLRNLSNFSPHITGRDENEETRKEQLITKGSVVFGLSFSTITALTTLLVILRKLFHEQDYLSDEYNQQKFNFYDALFSASATILVIFNTTVPFVLFSMQNTAFRRVVKEIFGDIKAYCIISASFDQQGSQDNLVRDSKTC